MRVTLIAGARPNFMKIGPIIHAIHQSQLYDRQLSYRLVHTGQHYDKNMSENFFIELGIPKPHVNLDAGGGTQAVQTGNIMMAFEKEIDDNKPDLVVVVGDVTSTLACSIVAKKAGVQVAHVEAGIRSGDMSMPEEINRIVTDSITDLFFTTSEFANSNLRKAGIDESRIFFVGNTMIDSLVANTDRFSKPEFWDEWGLRKQEYIVLTLHRPANVDDPKKFSRMMHTILETSAEIPVIFPVHPRTRKSLELAGIHSKKLYLIEPQSYLRFNYLVKYARAVITDSGGITEETTCMGVPCLTLRDSTERPETVSVGTNELVGTDPEKLAPFMNKLLAGEWKKGKVPDKWDGRASERIVNVLEDLIKRNVFD